LVRLVTRRHESAEGQMAFKRRKTKGKIKMQEERNKEK
jgi:hypothetical protein